MKKWIIILCFLHLSLNIKAQVFNNAFNNSSTIYSHPTSGFDQYSKDAFHNIIKKNNIIYAYGATQTPNWIDTTRVSTFIVQIDDYGDTISQTIIELDSFHVNVASQPIFDGTQSIQAGYIRKKYANTTEKLQGLLLTIGNNVIQSRTIFDFGDRTVFNNSVQYDSKLYVLGYADVDTSNNIDYDIFILKLDTFGNPLDTFQVGGNHNDIGRTLKILPNKNILISGYTESFGSGEEDFYLMEIDTTGNVVWEKTFGFPGSDSNAGENLILDENGNIYLCGWTELNSGNFVAWLVKTDMLGNLLWEKKFDRGQFFEGFITMSLSHDKNIIIAGSTHNYNLPGAPATGWLLKVDAAGQEIWERFPSKYNNENSTFDYVYDILVDNSGFIYYAGYVLGNTLFSNGIYSDHDAWLGKSDSCGYTTNNPSEAMLVVDSIIDYTVYISNLSTDYCTGQYTIGGEFGLLDTTNIYAYSAWANGDNPNQMQYTFQDTGSYEITLHVTGGDSTDSYTVQFNILDTVSSIKPHTFSTLSNITIYPNPTNDFVVVQNDFVGFHYDQQAFICDMFTVTGQKVASFHLNPNVYQQKLDLGIHANGVYLLHFSADGQQIGHKRLSVLR